MMLPLTGETALFLMRQDPTQLGAAIRVAVAGGDLLQDEEARRASGLTPYAWKQKGDAVKGLAAYLERAGRANV